ncbi:transposase [Mesorhizobium xinjiangense]|uniref:transposase n=1 Tax=Mesorhizobium xinjiangense TaxID=2678685 RepID=UPI0038B3FECF
MPSVELITSVERRRRWTWEEKEQLVAASFEPGMTVSEVARAAGIAIGSFYRHARLPSSREHRRPGGCSRPA